MSTEPTKAEVIEGECNMTVDIELTSDELYKRGILSDFFSTLVIDGVIKDIVDDTYVYDGTFVSNRRYIILRNVKVNPGDDFADTLKRVTTKCTFPLIRAAVVRNQTK